MLENIVKKHPELQISALLRSTPKGFVERYPSVSIITGTFNHYLIIQDAAYDADIVIRKTFDKDLCKSRRPKVDVLFKIPETLNTKSALVRLSPGSPRKILQVSSFI